MSDDARLTKKQRKTQAFRKGGSESSEKASKSKIEASTDAVSAEVVGDSGNDGIDAKADQDAAPISERKKGKSKAKEATNSKPAKTAEEPKKKKEKTNKNKLAVDDSALTAGAGPSDKAEAPATASGTKRKRDAAVSDSIGKPAKKATKQRFDDKGEATEVTAAKDKGAEDKDAEAAKVAAEQRRFIVFVGNMAFKSTSDELSKHFAAQCGETPTVRLLTTRGDASKRTALSKSKQKSIAKGKAADPGAPTSKGCAFVEFASHKALQKALQFHHTQFQGRSINVELTAGGGGKGQERKERIQKKNKDLEEERRKLHEKYIKGKKEEKQGAAAGDKAASAAAPPAPPQAQWGPRANAAGAKKSATKIPRWAASGANAIRLSE